MFPTTYVSIAEFDAIFTGNTYSTIQKEMFINEAENAIDSYLKGRTFVQSETETQERIFPARIIKDGSFLIPSDVKLCVFAIIKKTISNGGNSTQKVKSISSGEQSITYETTGTGDTENISILSQYLGMYLLTSFNIGV